jgi:hypothetical protein
VKALYRAKLKRKRPQETTMFRRGSRVASLTFLCVLSATMTAVDAQAASTCNISVRHSACRTYQWRTHRHHATRSRRNHHRYNYVNSAATSGNGESWTPTYPSAPSFNGSPSYQPAYPPPPAPSVGPTYNFYGPTTNFFGPPPPAQYTYDDRMPPPDDRDRLDPWHGYNPDNGIGNGY